jgi:hypothetical protein
VAEPLPGGSSEADVRFETLSRALWEERALLEELAYRLEAVRLMVVAGRHPYAVRAAEELERCRAGLVQAERRREAAAGDLAAVLGIAGVARLAELAEQAPPAWREALVAHRRALRAQLSVVERLGGAVREALAAGIDLARAGLAVLGVAPGAVSYGPDGGLGSDPAAVRLVEARA